MTLGIQDIVEVRAQIEPRGAGGREFGRTLLLTTDPTLDRWCGQSRGLCQHGRGSQGIYCGLRTLSGGPGLLLPGTLSSEPGDRPLDQHEGVG